MIANLRRSVLDYRWSAPPYPTPSRISRVRGVSRVGRIGRVSGASR
jgi:hypothetical protein